MKRLKDSRTAFMSFLICMLIAASATAATLRVEQDGSGDHVTIGAAISAASPGDTIEIGPGIYAEQLVTTNGLSFVSTHGPEATILDGGGSHRILWINGAAGCTATGLTFRNGYAYQGGAIHVDFGGTLLAEDCIFEDNRGSFEGGAIWVRHLGSSLEVVDCDFLRNSAPVNCGAAGNTITSTAIFTGCTFIENSTDARSGALANFDGSPLTVEHCVFIRNSGGTAGALLVQNSAATFRNNTFYENRSSYPESATINFFAGYGGIFEFNIVVETTAGAGVALFPDTAHDFNIFFGNHGGNVLGDDMSANESVLDPLFCNHPALDLTLCGSSPALPENNGSGLIGAFGQGCDACGPVPTARSSWGRIKDVFR